VPDKKTDIKP